MLSLILGYGRVTPLSDGGKGFCIVYAIIGIPLTLILFTALVERILIPVKAFLYFLFRKLGHVYQVSVKMMSITCCMTTITQAHTVLHILIFKK